MKKANWLHITVSVLFLLSLIVGSSAVAQSTSDTEANKATLMAFFEVEAARDFDRMGEFFAQDFVRHSVATTAVMPEVQVTSLDQYVEFLQATVAMFPDYANAPQMLIAEGDYLAFYSMWSGTSAQTGNWIELPIVGMVRFADGKIAEMWIEWDNLTWNTQMMAAAPVEAAISSIDDVVGAWDFVLENITYRFELHPDGTAAVFAPAGIPTTLNDPQCSTCAERGNYAVEGNQIHFLTSELFPTCGEARYDVFVTRQGEQPVSLRFDMVGWDCLLQRRLGLDGQTLLAAEP